MQPGRLNLTDRATLIYSFVVALLTILFAARSPSWYLLTLLNIAVMAAVFF